MSNGFGRDLFTRNVTDGCHVDGRLWCVINISFFAYKYLVTQYKVSASGPPGSLVYRKLAVV